MSYIDLMNQFWKLDSQYPFTPIETRLYFWLLNEFNRLGWRKTINHSERHVAGQLAVSVNSIRAARKTLVNCKLINIETTSNCTFYELAVSPSVSATVSTTVSMVDTIHKTKDKDNIIIIIDEGKLEKSVTTEAAKQTQPNYAAPLQLAEMPNEAPVFSYKTDGETIGKVLREDEVLHQSISISHELKREEITQLIPVFLSQQKALDKITTISNAKSHFFNWIPKHKYYQMTYKKPKIHYNKPTNAPQQAAIPKPQSIHTPPEGIKYNRPAWL